MQRILVIVAVLFSSMPCFSQASGIVQFSPSDIDNNSVALSGPWEFYQSQLLSPSQFPHPQQAKLVELPQLWSVDADSNMIGFGTYRLRIVLKGIQKDQSLAIRMPDVYSSHQIWIDKKEFPGNGKVGRSKEETTPMWLSQVFTFNPTSDTVEIVLQIANFHHSKGGIKKPIYLGTADYTVNKFEQAKTANTILFFVLLLIATIVGAIYFVVQEKSLAMIFYVCLCFAWATRVIFSNLYLAVDWFPTLDWNLVVRTEYITLYLTMVFGMLFVAYLFPRDVNKAFKIMYILFGSVFTIVTLVTPPILFTKFVQIYLSFSALLLLAILAIIIKAMINSRAGATLFLLNIVYGVGMFGYAILAYQGVFELDEIIFSVGFSILFISTGIAMGVRLMKSARASDSDMLTYDQLYGGAESTRKK